ncbi:4'-phosphopantetheinyl transferase superfamily protein [Marinobacter sp. MDS2]|uniref:4'-phosphopantetheinyl transferase family protein n=1 Tax=Marinobacter sp. MDS2 TaxID=3065961 RepID=UPI00273B73C8|nr:4'-phosphopantetheinyl transferase superfamily protein [Marinobacter sp. MDS2]MDP4547974.1 4'-phosphopantetheinyl transferase superfamily protein [Marinobacter sp. MDS2]
MPGQSNACNPDTPQIWLCHQISRVPDALPDWLTVYERNTLATLDGPRRGEYLSSRWLIRQGLSKISNKPADQCQPVNGRPIASRFPAGWHLSLSHSQGLNAVAIGSTPLGIDVEPSQRKPNWQGVAKRWFSPVEQEWLLRANDPYSFLKVWTLKEAWLKATRRGIAGNLQTLEVRKDFELYGDQPDRQWQSCCCYVEGFLSTLVYQTNDPDREANWPAVTLLEPPPEDYNLAPAEPLDTIWDPLYHRTIRAKR